MNNNFIAMIIIYQYFVNHFYETNIIIIISYYSFFYLIVSLHFYTTTIQGHDKFYVKTVDNVLSSSSELENTLKQHDNSVHVGKMIDIDGGY